MTTAPTGFEPVTLKLTASCTAVVLQGKGGWEEFSYTSNEPASTTANFDSYFQDPW